MDFDGKKIRILKLDDGWPESVEEQSLLLLLVWRHYITRQYIKDVLQADEKSSIKTILYGIVSFPSYLSKSFSRTELFLQTDAFCTQTLLHTDAFYTHTHTNTFTHRDFYTQTLITHRRFLHTSQFLLSVLGDPNLIFVRKGFHRKTRNRNFTSVFWRSNLISCERVAPDDLKSQFLPQFWAIEPHFVRKGCVSCRLVGTAPCSRLSREK